MFLIFFAISIIICLKIYWYFKLGYERFRKTSDIPSPKSYPFIGSSYHYITTREKIFKLDRHFYKTLGPIYKIWAFNNMMISIGNCKDMEVILSSIKHINKGYFYDFLHPWLGTGLLTSTGAKWQKQRKLLTPAFHWSILQEFQEIFNRETDNLVKILINEPNQPYTKINAFISQFTLHSIIETTMGYKLDLSSDTSRKYKQSIYKVGELMVNRIVKFWFHNPYIYQITTEGREFAKNVKLLHGFTDNVIKERRNSAGIEFTTKKRTKALLDLLLSAQQDNYDINDQGIREEVDTFTFEGQDTTYAAICFLLFNLANYPEIQDKVYDEMVNVLKDNPATIENLYKLPYTEMCIKESLRIYPSVPVIQRTLMQEVKLASGYIVPAEALIQLDIFDLHRDPTIFPDPEKYDPERFSPENTKTRHPFAYLPFSAGPRNCIGQKFAMLEIKTALAGILRNFKLKAVDKPEDLVFVSDLILRTKNDIKIKFLPRN